MSLYKACEEVEMNVQCLDIILHEESGVRIGVMAEITGQQKEKVYITH